MEGRRHLPCHSGLQVALFGSMVVNVGRVAMAVATAFALAHI